MEMATMNMITAGPNFPTEERGEGGRDAEASLFHLPLFCHMKVPVLSSCLPSPQLACLGIMLSLPCLYILSPVP